MPHDVVIRNGLVVTPQGVLEGGVAVEGEKIVAVGPASTLGAGRREIDVKGKVIFPGVFNPHTHLGNGEKVPHVGWNTLERLTPKSVLLNQIEPGAYAYFTHSYAAPVTDGVAAATAHGDRFAAVAERRNVFGVQFHPEKSGRTGLQILRNFIGVVPAGR